MKKMAEFVKKNKKKKYENKYPKEMFNSLFQSLSLITIVYIYRWLC